MRLLLVVFLLLASAAAAGACGRDRGDDDDDSAADGDADADADADADTDADADADGDADADADGDADADADADPDCAPGTRDGPAGDTLEEYTPLGFDYDVHVPDDYDPTVATPLVVVYSPAGVRTPPETEGFTGLPPDVLERGWIIATLNHVTPADQGEIDDAGSVAGQVATRWCIDETRVYFTGHSDGGSLSSILAIAGTDPSPAAIAPSAAGTPRGYLDAQPCPTALPVMVLHSADDSLFPLSDGFGEDAAAWWAECAGCDPTPGDLLPNGCYAWTNCDGGAEVQYCEGSGAHGFWPNLNADILDFFARFPGAI